DGRQRQVQVERLPGAAAIPRDEHTELSARKQQVAPLLILTNDTREGIARNARVDARPRRAVIGGLVQAGRVVVELVARRRDIRGAAVVRRHFDGVHQTLGQPLRRDVLPGRAAIARDWHQPIVTAGPDDALLVRRLGDVGERAVVLGADGFVGEWAAALALLVLLVARQVGRYLFPRPAHVTRLQQDLRAVVEGV